MSLKETLQSTLSETEIDNLRQSFDVIGDIAIIEIPDELEEKKQVIAEAVRQQHEQVQTVLRKTGGRTGEYRLGTYEPLLGEQTETEHVEHGCRYRLDPTQVYFSPRLGTERKRILNKTGDGETVNAWFAGVGPYPILLATKKNADCYAVEKNPAACTYLEENVYLNNVEDRVTVKCGDVKEIAPELNIKADRTLLPHPSNSFTYLPLAAQHTVPGGTLHVYTFMDVENKEKPGEAVTILREHDYTAHVEKVVECGTYSPDVNRVCLDIRLESR